MCNKQNCKIILEKFQDSVDFVNQVRLHIPNAQSRWHFPARIRPSQWNHKPTIVTFLLHSLSHPTPNQHSIFPPAFPPATKSNCGQPVAAHAPSSVHRREVSFTVLTRLRRGGAPCVEVHLVPQPPISLLAVRPHAGDLRLRWPAGQ